MPDARADDGRGAERDLPENERRQGARGQLRLGFDLRARVAAFDALLG